MKLTVDDFARRIDELIADADAVVSTKWTRTDRFSSSSFVDGGAIAGFRAAALSFLLNAFGHENPFYTEFAERVKGNTLTSANAGREILCAAKKEVAGGWFRRARELLAAELFSDFLEMAEYLLSEGYKDAAAVMLGSTLEEHLRELSRNRGIATERTDPHGKQIPKRADALNAELAASGAYSKLDQKAVTAWLDLRNKAAHGEYSAYTNRQVEMVQQGITDFMARVQR